jgi:hypothetical protein
VAIPRHFFQALLAYQLGEDGHAQLVPDADADQRITWSRYRAQVFPALVKAQKADGSWDDWFGDGYGTAAALAILQLEDAVLPIYQR